MPLRLFYCERCGHPIRFGASRCGKCHISSPVVNRKPFYWAAGLSLVALAIAGIFFV